MQSHLLALLTLTMLACTPFSEQTASQRNITGDMITKTECTTLPFISVYKQLTGKEPTLSPLLKSTMVEYNSNKPGFTIIVKGRNPTILMDVEEGSVMENCRESNSIGQIMEAIPDFLLESDLCLSASFEEDSLDHVEYTREIISTSVIEGHDVGMTTDWGQCYPFNAKMPDLPSYSIYPNNPDNKWPIGCAACAVGQVMVYHKKPHWFNGVAYSWNHFAGYFHDYDIPSSYKNSLSTIFQFIADKLESTPGQHNTNGTSGRVELIPSVFRGAGYTCNELSEYSWVNVKNDLDSDRPVIVCALPYGFEGHVFIIDKYYTTRTIYNEYYEEYGMNGNILSRAFLGQHQQDNSFVHILNCGSGSSCYVQRNLADYTYYRNARAVTGIEFDREINRIIVNRSLSVITSQFPVFSDIEFTFSNGIQLDSLYTEYSVILPAHSTSSPYDAQSMPSLERVSPTSDPLYIYDIQTIY